MPIYSTHQDTSVCQVLTLIFIYLESSIRDYFTYALTYVQTSVDEKFETHKFYFFEHDTQVVCEGGWNPVNDRHRLKVLRPNNCCDPLLQSIRLSIYHESARYNYETASWAMKLYPWQVWWKTQVTWETGGPTI